MDLLSNSIREKIEEIDNKIQQITYMQEFEKANAFTEVFERVQEQIRMMGEVESQTHLYYPQAMDALEVINVEIDDYMEKEGKTKKQELNRTIFLEKLKRFIGDTKGRNTETMLLDLKGIVKEVKDLELEENLFSEFNSLTAKALLSTFMKQAQKEEEIDLGLVEEVTTKEAFSKEIKNQLMTMAEEKKEDKVAAYDILKVCQEVKEENIGESKIWETLSGNAEVKIKQPEPKKELPEEVSEEKQLISFEPAKRTIFDRLRDRFGKKDGESIYTFGKFNEKTGQYENIRVEQHRFPPRGTFLERRCQKECIGLEINGEYRSASVEIGAIAGKMPNLQNLIFGKNVDCIEYGKYEEPDSFGRNQYLPSLKRVEFSDDVQMIGDHLFPGCENLTEVKFGKNVEKIGQGCFWNCGLKEVTLPDKLRKIDCGTFCACRELKEVKFPEKFLSRIEENAFLGCRSLEKVELPESMGEIQNDAFADCRNLETINLPNRLQRIGKGAFIGANIKNIKLPENLKEIGKNAFFSLKNDVNSAINVPKSMEKRVMIDNQELVRAFDSGVYFEIDGRIYRTGREKGIDNVYLEFVKEKDSKSETHEYFKDNEKEEDNKEDIDPRVD